MSLTTIASLPSAGGCMSKLPAEVGKQAQKMGAGLIINSLGQPYSQAAATEEFKAAYRRSLGHFAALLGLNPLLTLGQSEHHK